MKSEAPTIRLKFAVTKIGSGKTPLGGVEAYVPSGVMLLRSQNVHFDGLRFDDAVFIDEETDENMASTRVQPNDVLLNITGASLGRCAIVPKELARANVNQHVCILRPNPSRIRTEYLNSVLQSAVVQNAIFADENGSSREGLTFEQIGNLEIPFPALERQIAIADFLDRETARLDALVAEKERWLELVAEKRRALITRAVTRGLNPATPLRDSGLSWLGEIPAHWELKKLKFTAEISYGVGDELDRSLTSGVPLISLPNVTVDGSLNLDEVGWATLSEAGKQAMLLRRGDLLFNWRNGSSQHVGKTAYFDAEGEYTHVGFLLRIRFDLSRHDSRFFQYYLNTLRATGFFLYTRAMVNNTFNQTELENLDAPVPTFDEQRAIVAHISAETAKLDALRVATERTIGLLKERRAALIAAAVTGKIAVSARAASTRMEAAHEN